MSTDPPPHTGIFDHIKNFFNTPTGQTVIGASIVGGILGVIALFKSDRK